MKPPLMYQPKYALAALACAVLITGCSTAPPKPPEAKGPWVQANQHASALAELLDIARAATPRRYRAERAVSVRQTLAAWAEEARMELVWESPFDLSTSGLVDEFELRRAVMALAQQFRNENAALIIDLSHPQRIVVKQAQGTQSTGVTHQTCTPLPAGAIALGLHCVPVLQAWHIDPADQWLSVALGRWAQQAQLNLVWSSELDWPITLSTTRRYEGDVLSALQALNSDLKAQDIDLLYTLKAREISIEPRLEISTIKKVTTP